MNHCKTLTLILFLSSMLAWTADAQRIDLNLKDVTVKEAMETLKNRSGYSFVYEAGDIDARAKVSVKATRIEDAISQIVAGQNVSYELRGKNIVLHKTAAGQQKVERTITGIVKDANGLSVIGATILEKGNRTNGRGDRFARPVHHNRVGRLSADCELYRLQADRDESGCAR